MPKGSLVSGTVTQVDAKAALVDLGNGVIGRVKASEVSKERINDVTEWLQVGDVIEAKVLGVDRKAEVVNISIREMQAQAVHSGEAPTNNSLGAMLKEQLVRNNDQNTDQVECAPESPAALQAESQSAAESVAE